MPEKLMLVPVEQVRPAEDNVRSEVGDVEDLAESIAENGLIEPIRVQPDGRVDGAQSYLVVAGHRRLAACQRLHAAGRLDAGKVLVLVQSKASDEARVAAMLVENLHREDLNPVDQMRGFVRLVDQFGWSTAEVAKRCAVSPALVKSRVTWVKLPEHVLERVRAHLLTIDYADRLAKLPTATIATVTAKGKVPTSYDIDSFQRKAKIEKAMARFEGKVLQVGGFVSTQRAMKHMIEAHRDGDSTPPPATFPTGSYKVWEIVTAMDTPEMRWCSDDHEPAAGEVFTVTDSTYSMRVERLVDAATVSTSSTSGDLSDEERFAGLSDGEIAYEKAYDEWSERNDAYRAERAALIDAAVAELFTAKPAVIIESLLRYLVAQCDTYRADKIGRHLGLKVPASDAGVEAIREHAAISAAHLARTALAVQLERTGSSRFVEVPESDPPPRPMLADFVTNDAPDDADVDDVDEDDEDGDVEGDGE